MITVHHLNHSRSQRIVWLLEELGLAYDIRRYERDPKTMRAPASLRAVHPLGKSPVITDGDLTLAESGAIIDYLIERYGVGRLAPAAGTPARLRYTYWLHYAEGSAMSPLLLSWCLTGSRLRRCRFLLSPLPRPFREKPRVRSSTRKFRNTWTTWRLKWEKAPGSPVTTSAAQTFR